MTLGVFIPNIVYIDMTVKLMNEPIIETMTKELDDDEPFIQFDEDTIFEPLEYITY